MSGKTDYVEVTTMENLTKVISILYKSTRDWHAGLDSDVGGGHSSKELVEHLINNYLEHLHEASTMYIIV